MVYLQEYRSRFSEESSLSVETLTGSPLDISINRSAKSKMVEIYQSWYSEQVTEHLRAGVNAHDIKIDVSLTRIKPLHAKWIINIYNELRQTLTVLKTDSKNPVSWRQLIMHGKSLTLVTIPLVPNLLKYSYLFYLFLVYCIFISFHCEYNNPDFARSTCSSVMIVL